LALFYVLVLLVPLTCSSVLCSSLSEGFVCGIFFCHFLLSLLRCSVYYSRHVMVRGCKVRTLRPMASPLHQFVDWTLLLAFAIDVALLGWCNLYLQVCIECYLDSLAYSLYGCLLCLVLLDLTRIYSNASGLLAQSLVVFFLLFVTQGLSSF